jgi:hypothetical protein
MSITHSNIEYSLRDATPTYEDCQLVGVEVLSPQSEDFL